MVLDSGHFGDFSNLVRAILAHFFFWVESKLIIQRENLVLEELKGHNLTYIYQIFGHGNTDLDIFVHSETFDLWHDEALAQGLAHILSELVQDLQSGNFVRVVLVVSQSKSQLHYVFLVIILHNSPDVQKNINGFIFDLLIFVIQQLVEHPKDFSSSLVLLSLCALLLHKLDKWDELV